MLLTHDIAKPPAYISVLSRNMAGKLILPW